MDRWSSLRSAEQSAAPPVWVVFRVPCPTPSGRTADELLAKRYRMITPGMQAAARAHGCRFHRAFIATDRSAFYSVACWETRAGARDFFSTWNIDDEEGEEAIFLEGDIGLVPLP